MSFRKYLSCNHINYSSSSRYTKLDYYALATNEFIDLGVFNETTKHTLNTSLTIYYVDEYQDGTNFHGTSNIFATFGANKAYVPSGAYALSVGGTTYSYSSNNSSDNDHSAKLYVTFTRNYSTASSNTCSYRLPSSTSWRSKMGAHVHTTTSVNWQTRNNVYIGSIEGYSCTEKIESIKTVRDYGQTTTTETILYPYLDTYTNTVVFSDSNFEYGIYEVSKLYYDQMFSMEMLESGSISLIKNSSTSSPDFTLKYYRNNTLEGTISSGGSSISVSSGDVISFLTNSSGTWHCSSTGYGSYFSVSGNFNVYGNIFSMFLDDYSTQSTLADSSNVTGIVNNMLKNNTTLISSKNLFLGFPDTYLHADTYVGFYYMLFNGCTSMIDQPHLFPSTLISACYNYMFNGCSSLVNCKNFPATTLAEACCKGMYCGTGITKTPNLIFKGTLYSDCYDSMFYGCTSLTSAPELPATTLATFCYKEMFRNCTSLTTAPELPATDQSLQRCCSAMFYGCSNLNYVKNLATSISSSVYSHNNWLKDVSSSGTFVKNSSMTSWPSGDSGIPSGWTVEDAS